MHSCPNLKPVSCSMSGSNCFFLTWIQISQESGYVVWYSHLSKNFPQFVMIHTVKGFGVVNKTEVDVFLELSHFFSDPTDVGNLISGSSAFSKSILDIWKFTYCWSLAWRILSIALVVCEMSAIVQQFEHSLDVMLSEISQRKTNNILYHLSIESEKHSKLVNITRLTC